MKKIKIVGEIGWDVYARDIDRQLSFAKGDDVEIEIATPGGQIPEGLKMFNSIKNYEGRITFRMTGVVASMGSYIVLARGAENVVAEPNAIFMMHNPATCACGDYQVMGKVAKDLDDLAGHVAKTYAGAAGKTVEDIRTMLDLTTFIYGDDIVAQGFAGKMTEAEPAADADPAQAVALARVLVTACMDKVKAHEMSAIEAGELSAMVMKMTGHKTTPATPVVPVEKQEVIMTLKEMQEKYPALCEMLVAEAKAAGVTAGHAEGVKIERARVAMIVGFRAKFPKMHKVIDAAVTDGHDMTTLNLNIMSAQTATDEVLGSMVDGVFVPTGGGDGGGAEMVDGVMTTPEHLSDTSNTLAGVVGLSVPAAGGK